MTSQYRDSTREFHGCFAAIHAPGQAAALAACAREFSPLVEQTSPDTVVLDAGGLERLIGRPSEIARAIARAVEEAGVQASVAVASNCDAAVCAARGFTGVTVIPPKAEAKALAPLAVSILAPPAQLLETLDRWGIRTLDELAALPDLGVAERLGEDGLRLLRLARGENQRPLAAAEAPAVYEESIELDHPLELLEPLLFLLARLAGELCARLLASGLAANELRLRLKLENQAEHPVVIRLPVPMREAGVFRKLLQLELESEPPPAPVAAVTLRVEPVDPRVTQRGLFVPQAPEPEKLELTLARIGALVGKENVGAPELLDTHRPDAFRMRRGLGTTGVARQAEGLPHLALRRWRPPRAAQVAEREGRPVRVDARAVVRAAGPWRTAGDWWRETFWDRDEWDVALKDGALCLIFFDRRAGEWFAEGVYD
jgi:protein ImuB